MSEVYGSFTSNGVSKLLDIVSGAKYLKLTNSSAAGQFEWYEGYAAGTATNISNGAAVASNGVTAFTSAENVLGPEKTGTAITNANPAVVSIVGHGFQNGDIVKIYGTTDMRQIAGMFFKVSAAAANTFEIGLSAGSFAAPATAVKARKLQVPQLFEPRQKFIKAIGLGASTTITTSVDHGYSVGQEVSLQVPAAFGTVQLNGLSGRISSVPAVDQFVVDINSSAATAFAFPTSGSVPFSFAMVEPAGSRTTLAQGNVTPGASVNDGVRGLLLGSAVIGAAGNVIYYYATY